MPKVAGQSPSQFQVQRYARQELLLALTKLLATDEARDEKLLFIEAARKYLEDDERLDAHRSKFPRSYWERRHERAEVLTAVWMVPGEPPAPTKVLDVVVRAFGQFLSKEGARQ